MAAAWLRHGRRPAQEHSSTATSGSLPAEPAPARVAPTPCSPARPLTHRRPPGTPGRLHPRDGSCSCRGRRGLRRGCNDKRSVGRSQVCSQVCSCRGLPAGLVTAPPPPLTCAHDVPRAPVEVGPLEGAGAAVQLEGGLRQGVAQGAAWGMASHAAHGCSAAAVFCNAVPRAPAHHPGRTRCRLPIGLTAVTHQVKGGPCGCPPPAMPLTHSRLGDAGLRPWAAGPHLSTLSWVSAFKLVNLEAARGRRGTQASRQAGRQAMRGCRCWAGGGGAWAA